MPPKKAASGLAKTKRKLILWDRNGVDGGESSIEVVLLWLSTGNNYDRRRGHEQKGTTKTGLSTSSNPRGSIIVTTKKIGDLQSSYNTAHDFLKNTGEGIMATDELNSINTMEDEILLLVSPHGPTALVTD
ncbi:hypothetical protein PGTUg99_010536 [Puccinia graminis f. sp. tritici]|uniref:Uncharacterized protein n=1 Tax=Puccinia graminis f. sp. tritici TaxID=56615 RepID=A0A5B0QRU8_PUCGR|nr:hypothetical protein PGTUg99_010536 [Puccinia graminis f. sp. tritici]